MSPKRRSVMQAVANMVAKLPKDRISRVAIDGVDGAGKTTFADELAAIMNSNRRLIIRASVDGFHHPKAIRYQRGRHSPEGFFRDSYDYVALKRVLFDQVKDSPILCNEEVASSDSILIFDGIFLHRPEPKSYWNFSVFLDVDFKVSIPRGASRGSGFGSADPDAIENRRYIEGQKLYFRECRPKEFATIIIDNNILDSPEIILRR